MTAEEQLASKLESIKESIIGFKFATDALEARAAKIELELSDCRSRIAELSNAGIVVGEQLRTFNKSMEAQAVDIRAVRNSVLGAILTATIIWITGTAFSTIYNNRSPVPASEGRTA
jgi:hypothetical protein